MALTPEDVATTLQKWGSSSTANLHSEPSEHADKHRSEVLKDIYSTCRKGFDAKDEVLEVIAQKLGDGSRDEAWRIPYGESGILDLFLEILSTSETSHNLKVQSLRIVGNSCADTDENRARVVENEHLITIVKQLNDESLLPYAIPVLFNTLVDYEPAQRAASQSKLNVELTALLSSPTLADYIQVVPFICKILALLISQDGESAVANPQTVEILLNVAINSPAGDDAEDYISLVSLAAAYLANETFQTNLVESPRLDLFITAFYKAYTQFDNDADEDPDIAASLKQLRTSLLTSLADLTGNDSFATHHPLDSPVSQKLLGWLSVDHPQLQSAACLALGNLCRSDETATALVQEHNAHQPLINTLFDASITDAQQLHSALSCLKNLAIPSQNKTPLGELLEPSGVPRILTLDTLPQVQFAAASLTRLLLVNSPSNVRRACAPRKATASSDDHTTVHDILSLFDRSDAEPTKLEAARGIAAICRVLHSNPVLPILPDWDPSQADISNATERQASEPEADIHGDNASELRNLFYKKHDLTKALSFLITQPKWPILRSEAWFVFALMSRSKDGATVILDILSVQEAANALTHAVTGQTVAESSDGQKTIENSSSEPVSELAAATSNLQLEPQQVDPKQKDSMARIDRENCLVLCTEIVKTLGDQVPTAQARLLQDLIAQGTELVVSAREKE